MKFREILEALERDPVQISNDQKREFVEAVKKYSELGESVYAKGNLKELCERVKYMVEMAQQVTLAEGDWFDGITVNRHMKSLNESYKVFEKTAQEISRLQERLSSAYEDIGQGLGKYFDIN
tara:strand:- start:144 stop:509 length:366 start_codon:yes stop_codon:yes gene_type:complete